MQALDSVRAFLRAYRQGSTTADLTEGQSPPQQIRDAQERLLGASDDHVIPLQTYEFRVNDDQSDPPVDAAGTFKIVDDLGRVEQGWDHIMSMAGLDAVSTYAPFHADSSTYGIYISQRGIRYLGHLLYGWSQAGDLSDSPSQATTLLQDHTLATGGPLSRGQPQFASIEAAFELAQELLLRYQWFYHQFELLAAHFEDARDEPLYRFYHDTQHTSPADPMRSQATTLALAYAWRSQACRNKSPPGLFEPLFRRTISFAAQDYGELRQYTDRSDFEDGCYELSERLSSGSASGRGHGIDRARDLPFETDIRALTPRCLSVFVTRREPDPDDGSYAMDEFPLDEEWDLATTDTWETKFNQADGSLISHIESTQDKMGDDPRKVEWKGDGTGPRQTYYANLTDGKRFVFSVDRQNNAVTLKDFGDHDIPKEYGLHVN